MDRPRLVGWSSLCHARRRRLTSLVVVTGTVPPVPLPAAQLVRAPPLAVEASGVYPRDQDRPACAPCGAKRVKVGTPSVVSRVTGLPQTPTCACLVDRECHAGAHTVLTPRLAPAACVSTPYGAPLSQRRSADLPCGSSCFATRDASDRLLPSHVFVRAPVPRGFPGSVTGFRSRLAGGIAWFTPVRFASADRTLRFLLHRGRRCLPLATCADALLTPLVAAASSGPASLARLVPSVSMPPRLPPARPREAVRVGERPEMSSIQQGPLPRGALSSARLRSSPAPRLGHRGANHRRLCDRFLPFSGLVPTLAPVHPSRCHRVRASLSLGDACRLLQPGYDARAHPNEPKALARQWSFRPAVTPAPTDAGCVGPSVSFAHLLACEP